MDTKVDEALVMESYKEEIKDNAENLKTDIQTRPKKTTQIKKSPILSTLEILKIESKKLINKLFKENLCLCEKEHNLPIELKEAETVLGPKKLTPLEQRLKKVNENLLEIVKETYVDSFKEKSLKNLQFFFNSLEEEDLQLLSDSNFERTLNNFFRNRDKEILSQTIRKNVSHISRIYYAKLAEFDGFTRFMNVFKNTCRDEIECQNVYLKLKLDLRENKDHARAYLESDYDTVMSWLISDETTVEDIANTAEERLNIVEGYTRKTSKGEEEVHHYAMEYSTPEFDVPEFTDYKPIKLEEPLEFEINDEEDVEDDMNIDAPIEIKKWQGTIHLPFSTFKGYAYQVYGITHNVMETVFSPHIEFQKTIPVQEMNTYLSHIKDLKKSIMLVAFWLLPDDENDSEFKKSVIFHKNNVGVALSLRRPWVKDMFIVGVKANSNAPSVFTCKDQDGKILDMFITQEQDSEKDRLLIISTLYVYHPIPYFEEDYKRMVEMKQRMPTRTSK
eukprot:NODE_79_length_23048_cov_0.747614.p8 type:complete len:503 gc:universal NODE_79_length_23048_cov_0.747614:13369-11861(-)